MNLSRGGQRPVLVCLPHAGGSAAFFRPWQTKLAGIADIVPVEIAGHGARRNEPVPVTFEAALASVWPTVRGHARGRYALFGHSLGALYAFELARRMGRPPLALIVSGRNTPARSSEMPQCHELPDTAFADRLASYGGIPVEIYRDPGLMRLFLPVLRADMRIAECYRRAAGPSLRCPIIAFYGEQDPLVSPDGVAGWKSETTGGCEIVSVPGGHFCLGDDVFTGRLAASLARVTRWSGL
jgi:medium-chain acyl-[acyl-carrier-protein] hydrolase